MKNSFKMTGIVLMTLLLILSACSHENPLSSDMDSEVKSELAHQSIPDLPILDKTKTVDSNKHKYKAIRVNVDKAFSPSFPLIGSTTLNYCEDTNGYQTGVIKFGAGNKSKFSIPDSALTPPPGCNVGDPVTITMRIDYDVDNRELIYTFGPHGCQFSPGAELKLDYGVLGLEMPKLYYIDDDGNRVEQRPEQISFNQEWLKIRLDHFSRYAVSWAE